MYRDQGIVHTLKIRVKEHMYMSYDKSNIIPGVILRGLFE